MSDYTRTPNLRLYKPTPDADSDIWGDHLNWNADTLDSTLGPGGTLPYLALSGGTVTGPTTIQRNVVFTPTTGGTIGLAVSGSMSGTMGNVGGVAPFEILISSNNIDSTANPGSSFFAQTIQHNFGATKGGQGCLNMVMTQTADVLDTGTVFINPLFVQLFANKGGGGAGNAIAGAVTCNVGGTGWGLAEGNELGMSVTSGASVQQAYIETFVWNAAVRPTAIDAANCYVSNPGNAFGTRAIWQIGRNGAQWPLDAAGWLLTTTQQINNNPGLTPRLPQAAAGGLDFSKINFSTAALRTSGVALGNATVTIGTGRLSEGASGLVIDALGQIGAVASIAAGGSLYQVNDQLYDGYGGIILVTAVSSGVVTAASYIAGREPYVFVAPPANPLATTGGSGSGATINVTWTARTGLSLNPGGGTTTFGGPVTVGGTLGVTGASTLTGAAGFANGISFGTATGASNTDNSKHIILNTAGTTYGINVTAGRMNYSAPGAGVLHGFIVGGADRLTVSDTIATFTVPTRFNGTIGFNNTTPVAKPTVSGAKGSNAALASLMTALAAYGLVTDSTTA